MEDRISRINRHLYSQEGVTVPTPESNSAPESILDYYSTQVFNTPETNGQLDRLSPLLSVLDSLSPKLKNKKTVLTYLHWVINDASTDTADAELGISPEEYKEHLDRILDPNHPEQKSSEELLNKFENLSIWKKTAFVKNLIAKGWTTSDINSLINSQGDFVANIKKKLDDSDAESN